MGLLLYLYRQMHFLALLIIQRTQTNCTRSSGIALLELSMNQMRVAYVYKSISHTP